MKKKFSFICFLLIISSAFIQAQEEKIEWKRTQTTERPDLHLFHSTQSFSLPTAEVLQKGNLQFEISHRFYPYIRTGYKTFYGIDGPVSMRIGLNYALSNALLLSLARSNTNGNVDLWLKYKFLQLPNDFLPFVAALRAGSGWATETGNRSTTDRKNFQFYGQLILNTLYRDLIGIGLVPSYLYNSNIFTPDYETSATMGTYLEVYLTRRFGLIFEWNPTISGYRLNANPMAFGIEIDTGGHFFKILLTNATEMNPSQYLAGTQDPVKGNNWRLGFNITRLFEGF